MKIKLPFLKWRRRPPKVLQKLCLLIVLLFFAISCDQVCANSQEDFEDQVEIIVESTPYSLKFYINDTENYAIESVACKSFRSVEETVTDEFVCDKLDPCTTYLATLNIKLLSEDKTFEKIKNADTDYAEPVVQIVKVESGTEDILLGWTSTHRTCISWFEIEAKSSVKNYKYTLKKEETEFLMDGLSPCLDHYINLKTNNTKNEVVSNLSETSRTGFIEPGMVTGIEIDTDYENAHAKVTWMQPEHKTCIDFYYLQWSKKDCESFEDVTCSKSIKLPDYNTKEYIINGLDGCEIYDFMIFINNETNAKSEITEFQTSEIVPSAVLLKEIYTESTKVTLYWDAPETNRKCVKNYEVIVNKINGEFVADTSTDDLYAPFEGLEPCDQYAYTVQPISIGGNRSDLAASYFVTLEAAPSAIRDLTINAEPYSMRISWQEPSFANLCVKEYRVIVWTNGKEPENVFSQSSSETKMDVNDLIACQSYTVQIIPVTKEAQDGAPMQMETETAAAVQTPGNLQYTSIYSEGIELSVTNTNKNNSCDTFFAKFTCIPNLVDEQKTKKSAIRNVEFKRVTSFKALLAPLSPFTEYKCSVVYFNIAGISSEKITIETTKPYFAEPPEDVSLIENTHSSLKFGWKAPRFPNGAISVYSVHFQRVRVGYFVPKKCPLIATDAMKRESTVREQLFLNLQSYTRYSIQVAAKNDYGIGEYTRPFLVITDPSVSEPITNLKVTPQGPFESDEVYHANVLVSWTIPCKSNGQILKFELVFHAERGDVKEYFTRSVEPKWDTDGVVVYNETNLKPEYNYNVSVAVRTVGVDDPSAVKHDEFIAPSGIPKRLNETTVQKARVDTFVANNPTNSAVVRFPATILETEAGTIVYAALLISQRGCNTAPPLVFGALNSFIEWPESRKWAEVYHDDHDSECIQQYQTTSIRWQPVPDEDNQDVIYTIGTEKCSHGDDFYCNGPLKPDTEYFLVIRLFTKSGYNDVVLLDFRTESLIQLELILISVSCCLLFALIAGFIYIYMKKRMQWKSQSCHDIEDPFGDIMAKNFATYYNEVSKPERIAREFKELTMVAMDFSYSASELGCSKNRYKDIYPYDKNRVILDIDADGSDYINGSFIDGYRQKKQYIATQGPKPESTLDFWRMVLQHNIRVIVMLTQFCEGDVIKCHNYFPYKSKGINVTIKNKETFDLYDRTEMSVTHDKYGLKQKVIHFYFKKWPDHGCPVEPLHLIQFVRKVRAEKVPSYSSIVVHCSAGVGRTGTFIGLDIIMQRLKSESKINIFGIVKNLRFQRMKMVQTLEQYTFLYKCTYELVKHKNQRNKQKKTGKRVSFETETEANVSVSTIINLPNIKMGGRQMSTELSAIQENEFENNDDTRGISHSGDYRSSEKRYLTLENGICPPINGVKKRVGFEFPNEQNEGGSTSNESVM